MNNFKDITKDSKLTDDNELLDIFSRFSHDIKNMLSTMYASYQLMELRDPSLKNNVRWETLKKSMHNMNSYIDEVSKLRYSYCATLEKLDLCDIVSALPDLCDDWCEDDTREFTFSLPKEPVYAMVDKEKLTIALMEIMKNCYEATSTDDVISISLSDDKHIAISDGGQGIADDIKDHIFQPYFTTKNNHIGIGLAIASNVVKAHNGEIKMECAPDGTTLHILLP